MAIYDNTSTLYNVLNKINNLSKTDINLLENKLIERTATILEISDITTIGDKAFANYTTLQSVNFPQCTNIGVNAFNNCSSLTTASFPQCTTIGNSAFQVCTHLTILSFPKCEVIGNYAFNRCSNLSSLYLTNSFICTLLNSNAFNSTSITVTTGSIFVPASLVASYKTAVNWSYFAGRIYSQGDSENEY